MTYALACLDMAGTTVRDDGLVERAFTAAVGALGIAEDTDAYQSMIAIVRETMGQSKIQVFLRLFGSAEAAHRANVAFERAYADLVRDGAVTALPGAAEVLATLRAGGVRIALTTGFARATQESIVDALGWRDAVDLLVCPSGALRGRPYPDMVVHAAKALGGRPRRGGRGRRHPVGHRLGDGGPGRAGAGRADRLLRVGRVGRGRRERGAGLDRRPAARTRPASRS